MFAPSDASRVLTTAEICSRTRSRSVICGRKFSETPNGTNATPWPTPPNDCVAAGTGNSPPARNCADWPFSVTRFGSAIERAKFSDRKARMASETCPLSSIVGRLAAEESRRRHVRPWQRRWSPAQKTVIPLSLAMLKSMPMLRAAVRSTSATVTRSMTCCSPGTRSRLMTLRLVFRSRKFCSPCSGFWPACGNLTRGSQRR